MAWFNFFKDLIHVLITMLHELISDLVILRLQVSCNNNKERS